MIFFRLLIGAPEAQTSQPGVVKGGAVFRCSTFKDDCEEILFDTRGEFFTRDPCSELATVKT